MKQIKPKVTAASDGYMDNTIFVEGVRAEQYLTTSVQCVWNISSLDISEIEPPVGTVQVQVSNDNARIDSPLNVTTWTDLTDGSAAVSGSSGSVIFNLLHHGYRFIRVIYTRTSGFGTLIVSYQNKTT